MMPLFTDESNKDSAVLNAATACSLSPDLIATYTFFTNVRSLLRCPLLRIRFTSACLARFFACGEFAMMSLRG